MDLNTILAKKPEELSDEEKAFVREHQAEMTDEQKTTFAAVMEAPAESETSEEPETPEEPAPPTPEAPVEARERGNKGKQIAMSEPEVSVLRAKADAGQKAFDDLHDGGLCGCALLGAPDRQGGP